MTDCNTVVVLVNYNSFSDTKACIQSIKQNKEDLTPFIIIVDNASEEVGLLKDLQNIYTQLQVLENSENEGFAKANNKGIEWAFKNLNFKHLLLLNNDTLVETKSISKLIESFKKDSSIGMVTGRIMFESQRNKVWYGGGELNFNTGRPTISDLNQSPSKEGACTSRYVSFASGCLMLFKKECLEVVEGFDEDYFMYCEDVELSHRLLKSDYKIWYNADSVIYHKVGGSQQDSQFTGLHPKNPTVSFHFYHKLLNLWITFKKHNESFNPVRFRINFIALTSYKLFYLVLFSKYRSTVIKSFFHLLKSIYHEKR